MMTKILFAAVAVTLVTLIFLTEGLRKRVEEKEAKLDDKIFYFVYLIAIIFVVIVA